MGEERRRRRLRLHRERTARERRSRWRWVLLVGGGVLAGYYALVLTGLSRQDAGMVELRETEPQDRRAVTGPPTERLAVQIEATELDTSTGSFDVRLRPLPRGGFAETGSGELRAPLQLSLSSAGEPPMSFDFPAQQLVDPVGASVDTTTGAHGFPFDRPLVSFRIEAVSEDRPVPIDLEMVDATEGWHLAGAVRQDAGGLDVELGAGREMLSVSFALFYIAGIVVVALITVAVIGGAIARGRVDFEQVIWLGAMLVAIPAVRNEMPGVPPVGTAVDLFVFLPSVVIVGLALLAAIVVLAINEAAASSPSADPAITEAAGAGAGAGADDGVSLAGGDLEG